MATKQSCKTCKFWDIDDARTKVPSGKIMPGYVSPCLYKLEIIKLPESHPRFYDITHTKDKLRYMSASDGNACGVHEVRTT